MKASQWGSNINFPFRYKHISNIRLTCEYWAPKRTKRLKFPLGKDATKYGIADGNSALKFLSKYQRDRNAILSKMLENTVLSGDQ